MLLTKRLRRIPKHDASEGRVLVPRLRRNLGELGGIDVLSNVSRSVTSRSADVNLDIRVRADGLGPVIPGAKVPRVLVIVVEDTTIVVVELDVDGVESNGRDGLSDVCIREHTLWGGSEVVLLVFPVADGAELPGERGIPNAGTTFNVEVDTVEDDIAEGAGSAGTTEEEVPNRGCECLSLRVVREDGASGGTTEGDEN